jgi:hypothetical protein
MNAPVGLGGQYWVQDLVVKSDAPLGVAWQKRRGLRMTVQGFS